MSHRPGHIDNTGDNGYSLDRRKYLKTIAIGAVAAGTAGVILKSCSEEKTIKPIPLFGTLSLYKPGVKTIKEANDAPDKNALFPPEDQIIRIPFFNSNQIDIKENQTIGFHLLKIGIKSEKGPLFAIAVNLVNTDDDKSHQDPDFGSDEGNPEQRNMKMDEMLRKMYGKCEENQAPAEEKKEEEKK